MFHTLDHVANYPIKTSGVCTITVIATRRWNNTRCTERDCQCDINVSIQLYVQQKVYALLIELLSTSRKGNGKCLSSAVIKY